MNSNNKGSKDEMASTSTSATFVVVGGGIAGVSCVEGLSFLNPEEKVILITASSLIKAVTNVVPLGKLIMKFDIEERAAKSLSEAHSSVDVVQDKVIRVNPTEKIVETKSGHIIKYQKLCLCTGARPKLIAEGHERVLGIRDTESVEEFSKKLQYAKRILVLGNGGIATELVHEVQGVEMIWVIKDKHISAAFVDPGAAEFFQYKLLHPGTSSKDNSSATKRMKYTISGDKVSKGGPALGPDWHNNFRIEGTSTVKTRVQVEYECEVLKILEPEDLKSVARDKDDEDPDKTKWPIYVELTNGKIVGADFIVSATGVIPNSDILGLESLNKYEDYGFAVDWKMETSHPDVYAAGDVCTASWEPAEHWFQMRLWTQAQQMGQYAARSMNSSLKNEQFFQDFCFELFTHVTKFFGYKVVLIGLFNAQKLGKEYEILLRTTRGKEYIKLVLKNGKLQGAVLIGDTDLEEMCENLILNGLDLSIYGEDLLNPDIDIEDYFD
ncbi:pyridine nucleotide-disulfide oxidoreductase domain-containing protein 1 [Cephus cinctus]|uniref:Pyridine nucleotide-disulfide oxidoreductase domain-containing protein 1 n=1 Tax=Cephus cinctus TaxID=211228 RepID=A0AAJ7FR36_CEPCN|nr:pyridine nucleotide-disulfide oxidoreductase domain-containing protein 1 [Cephus cinctus]